MRTPGIGLFVAMLALARVSAAESGGFEAGAAPSATTATSGSSAPEYAFEENLKDSMEAGEKNLAAGRLDEAGIDFENALTLDPENERALERLFDVYEKSGKKLLAEKLLERMRSSGKAGQEKLAALEKRLDAIVAVVPRPARAASTAQAGGAQGGSSATPVAASSRSSPPATPAGGGDGLDELERDLGAADPVAATPDPAAGKAAFGGKVEAADAQGPGGSGAAEQPATSAARSTPATVAPPDADLSKLTPEQKFEQSVALAKQKNYQRAIPLYVAALQANNGLLARDDFGLRALSQSYYESRTKADPKNPQFHFMIGWFAELDSRNDDALKAYEEVARLTRPGDDLHGFATLKVEQIQALSKQLALAQAQQAEKRREAAREKELADISRGQAKGLTAADYLKKGSESFEKWKKDKSASVLAEALAYYQGAVAVDGKNPKVRLALARVKIDQAIAGDASAKTVARQELEAALKLNPDAETKKQVQSLLDGLSGTKPAAK
ncbi:MAG: hypothetical protein HY816_11170 [Candidatus Wallbacteria bacterium]|nr:hypothetical protein [Candidatus Wallbacteria bacterium]